MCRRRSAGPGAIVGRVTNDAQQPLADAVVTAGAQAVKTDADGKFTIGSLTDLLQLAIQASKQGHLNQSHLLQLQAGENRCDFTLTACTDKQPADQR